MSIRSSGVFAVEKRGELFAQGLIALSVVTGHYGTFKQVVLNFLR